MLTIRDEQMRVMSLALFQRWVETHLREHFPNQCAPLEGAELRRRVQCGLKKAGHYGFVQEADLCRYVDLIMVLGADFDTDPRFPWASAILNNPAFKSPGTRMETLFEAACEHLRTLEQPAEVAAGDEAGQPEPEEEEEDEYERVLAPEADEEEEDEDEEEEEKEDEEEEDEHADGAEEA
jgi:hypothetical protein